MSRCFVFINSTQLSGLVKPNVNFMSHNYESLSSSNELFPYFRACSFICINIQFNICSIKIHATSTVVSSGQEMLRFRDYWNEKVNRFNPNDVEFEIELLSGEIYKWRCAGNKIFAGLI